MKHKKSDDYVRAMLTGIFAALLMVTIILAAISGIRLHIQKKQEAKTLSSNITETQTETQMKIQTEIQTETQTEIQTESGNADESETETKSDTEQITEKQILVAIDAGHQGPGQDMSGYEPIGPGASEMKLRIVSGTEGRTTGLAEYDLDLSVSLLLEQELINRGYQVIMTRTTNDINIGNVERAQIANDANADIMVRIHANGSEDASVSGALTMVPSASNPYVSHMYSECRSLASCIINAYCSATGFVNDGILEVDNMTGINWCQMPVTIVEMGFMTNAGDDTYMADPQNQVMMAKGIADGIDQYFGR